MPRNKSPQIIELSVLRPHGKPNLGERIGVYWQCDKRFYTGHVSSVNQNGTVVVDYDDGVQETLKLDDEVWEFKSDPMRYKTPSRNESESNPSSATNNNDRNTEGRGNGEPNEEGNRERNISRGQASARQQEGGDYEKRTPLTGSWIYKPGHAAALREARRARRTQREMRLRGVEGRGTRRDTGNEQDVENEQERESEERN